MVSTAFGALVGDPQLAKIALYQLVGQLLGAALQPYFRALEYKVNEATPNAVLTPDELASAVVRGFMDGQSAEFQATESGINAERFRTLVQLAGQALPPEAAAVALRRGIIPEDGGDADSVGFRQAIAQGNLANKWADVIKALSTEIPSPGLALNALLEGQIEEGEARRLYALFGGDPDYFTLAFHTNGSSPTPVELGVLANRRIIPWDGTGPDVVSYEQGFLEGPWRNKWLQPFKDLAKYRIPPRSVTAMVRNGALTDEQALQHYRDYGLTAEDAAAMLHEAHSDKTSAAHTLARSTIEALYEDRVIDRPTAIEFLVSEKYSERDADYLLQVVDLRREQQAITAAIARIRSLYTSYKITPETVAHTLTTLGIAKGQQDDLIAIWNLERVANQKELTPAQIEGAHFYKVIDQDAAMQLLVQAGYTPHDAWIALSVRSHKALPNEPDHTAVGLAPGNQT